MLESTKIYTKVYRQNFDYLTETEIEATIRKLDLIKRSYLGGVSIEVLKRQIGLEEQEIKNIVFNYREEVERIKQYKKYCLKGEDISSTYITEMLYKNQREIVRRLLDGEPMKEICDRIGIYTRNKEVRSFIKHMKRKGYFLGKEKTNYMVMQDINQGLTEEEILEKYPRDFVDIHAVSRYIEIHLDLYAEGVGV